MATTMHDPAAVERARDKISSKSEQVRLERARRALCEPIRVHILKALEGEQLSVTDLATLLRKPPEVASQHLRVLRELHIVEGTRHGRMVFYRLTERGRRQFASMLGDIGRHLRSGARQA